MPDNIRKLCRLADISSKSLLLQIVRQQTPEKMSALVEQLTKEGPGTRRGSGARCSEGEDVQDRPPKGLRISVPPANQDFDLRLQFKKSDVDRQEVIAVLEDILKELRSSK
jgi:ParB family chromosome partitioning protein